jgi:hypothetical protein
VGPALPYHVSIGMSGNRLPVSLLDNYRGFGGDWCNAYRLECRNRYWHGCCGS